MILDHDQLVEIMARAIHRKWVEPECDADDLWMLFPVDRELNTKLAQAALSALTQHGLLVVPRQPSEAIKKAAFGPIILGGRNGPISADFIRQSAALMVYEKMLDAADISQPEKGK